MVEIFDGVFAYIHPFGANCNVYAFKDPDGPQFDLVDTGLKLPFALRLVLKRMLKDGLDPRNLRDVYHTHGHFDHTQADAYFQRRARDRNPGVRIFCPEHDAFRFDPGFDLVDHSMRELLRYFPARKFREFRQTYWTMKLATRTLIRQPPVRRLTPLVDGQVVTLGGRQAQVLTTGGHTEGHSFLRFEEDRILVVGDCDAPNETTVDFGKITASMLLARDVLASWDARSDEYAILIGHNPVKRGRAALGWAEQYIEQFNQLFSALMGRTSGGATIDVTRLMERLGGYLLKLPFQLVRFFAFTRVFIVLKYLKERGYGSMRLGPGDRVLFETSDELGELFERDFPLGK
ncbi:MAG: MBL fold metallo-hydrolase [Promethearchaeota archaeon]